MPAGTVSSIHITPIAAGPMHAVPRVEAVSGRGLEGDRYFSGAGTYSDRRGPHREVTLIEAESIEALARDYRIRIAPGDARRNLVTEGIALNHLVGRRFRVGETVLQGIRLCEPCTHLAGLTATDLVGGLVHRGGLRAQILQGGTIHVGDPVEDLGPAETAPGTERRREAVPSH